MSYEAYKIKELDFETKQLHYGYNPYENSNSKQIPIYQSTAFSMGEFERSKDIFAGNVDGFYYARSNSPTVDIFERRIAALEDGIEAVAFASGSAAIAFTIMNLAKQGDEIVAVQTLYGGTVQLFKDVLPDCGITTRFVSDPLKLEDYECLINEKTKCIYVESLGNPLINVIDFKAVAELAHKHNIPLVVDNTFSPYIFRPFEHGADIVVYSGTKYLSGHGNTMCGVVVEKGDFDFFNGKYPQLEKHYANLQAKSKRSEKFKNYIFSHRLRMHFLMEFGAHFTPFSAYLLLTGLETLSLRMTRHAENVQKVAEFLENHPKIEKVNYPLIKSSPYYDLSCKYFKNGVCAILSFDVKGTQDDVEKLINKLKIFDNIVNVGDSKSLICHPKTTVHSGLTEEDRQKAGVFENTVRMSVGLENVDDLINDLKQGLDD